MRCGGCWSRAERHPRQLGGGARGPTTRPYVPTAGRKPERCEGAGSMSTNEEELSPLAADMAAVDAGVRALQRNLDDIHAARRHLAGPEVIAGLYDEMA